jgi:hypothetical protein
VVVKMICFGVWWCGEGNSQQHSTREKANLTALRRSWESAPVKNGSRQIGESGQKSIISELLEAQIEVYL